MGNRQPSMLSQNVSIFIMFDWDGKRRLLKHFRSGIFHPAFSQCMSTGTYYASRIFDPHTHSHSCIFFHIIHHSAGIVITSTTTMWNQTEEAIQKFLDSFFSTSSSFPFVIRFFFFLFFFSCLRVFKWETNNRRGNFVQNWKEKRRKNMRHRRYIT